MPHACRCPTLAQSCLTPLAPAAGWQAVHALLQYAERGVDLSRCTVSSDAFGSYPTFDEQGRLVEYKARAITPDSKPSGHIAPCLVERRATLG